jgi:tripartite-type tricarboxylate transporter receptor subunit TctC
MKRFICLIAVICVLGLTAPFIQAQPYPNRPIELIIAAPAGGGGDVLGRLLAQNLEKSLGVKIVALNKPGGSDTLAADTVVRAKKDGYTILNCAGMATVYARAMEPEIVPYDPIKDLTHLGVTFFFPIAIVVQANSPWKTFAEMIDEAKKNPGKIRFSVADIGSTTNFALEMIQAATGVTLSQWGGGPAVVTALLGGHVEASCDQLGKFAPQVEAGKLRFLLTTKKVPVFPNVPTLDEFGYKQEMLNGYYSLFAPAGVPEEVKKVLVPAIEKATKSPEIKAKVEKLGYIVDYKPPEESVRMVIRDYEAANAIALKIGLRKKK